MTGAVRGAGFAVLGAIAAGGVALGFSLSATPSYTATATVLVSTPVPDASTSAGRSVPVLDPGRVAQTNERLLSLPVIAQRTAARIEGETQASVSRHVSISVDGDSYLYAVTATSPRPGLAARLANTYAGQFVVYRTALDTARLDVVIARIRAQLGNVDASRETAALADLASSQAKIVQPAVPPGDASSPRTVRNSVLAAVLGLTLALGLLLARHAAVRRPG
jgi:uncharacterized protein involved in exopolysaccharide biosynthesis